MSITQRQQPNTRISKGIFGHLLHRALWDVDEHVSTTTEELTQFCKSAHKNGFKKVSIYYPAPRMGTMPRVTAIANEVKMMLKGFLVNINFCPFIPVVSDVQINITLQNIRKKLDGGEIVLFFGGSAENNNVFEIEDRWNPVLTDRQRATIQLELSRLKFDFKPFSSYIPPRIHTLDDHVQILGNVFRINSLTRRLQELSPDHPLPPGIKPRLRTNYYPAYDCKGQITGFEGEAYFDLSDYDMNNVLGQAVGLLPSKYFRGIAIMFEDGPDSYVCNCNLLLCLRMLEIVITNHRLLIEKLQHYVGSAEHLEILDLYKYLGKYKPVNLIFTVITKVAEALLDPEALQDPEEDKQESKESFQLVRPQPFDFFDAIRKHAPEDKRHEINILCECYDNIEELRCLWSHTGSDELEYSKKKQLECLIVVAFQFFKLKSTENHSKNIIQRLVFKCQSLQDLKNQIKCGVKEAVRDFISLLSKIKENKPNNDSFEYHGTVLNYFGSDENIELYLGRISSFPQFVSQLDSLIGFNSKETARQEIIHAIQTMAKDCVTKANQFFENTRQNTVEHEKLYKYLKKIKLSKKAKDLIKDTLAEFNLSHLISEGSKIKKEDAMRQTKAFYRAKIVKIHSDKVIGATQAETERLRTSADAEFVNLTSKYQMLIHWIETDMFSMSIHQKVQWICNNSILKESLDMAERDLLSTMLGKVETFVVDEVVQSLNDCAELHIKGQMAELSDDKNHHSLALNYSLNYLEEFYRNHLAYDFSDIENQLQQSLAVLTEEKQSSQDFAFENALSGCRDAMVTLNHFLMLTKNALNVCAQVNAEYDKLSGIEAIARSRSELIKLLDRLKAQVTLIERMIHSIPQIEIVFDVDCTMIPEHSDGSFEQCKSDKLIAAGEAKAAIVHYDEFSHFVSSCGPIIHFSAATEGQNAARPENIFKALKVHDANIVALYLEYMDEFFDEIKRQEKIKKHSGVWGNNSMTCFKDIFKKTGLGDPVNIEFVQLCVMLLSVLCNGEVGKNLHYLLLKLLRATDYLIVLDDEPEIIEAAKLLHRALPLLALWLKRPELASMQIFTLQVKNKVHHVEWYPDLKKVISHICKTHAKRKPVSSSASFAKLKPFSFSEFFTKSPSGRWVAAPEDVCQQRVRPVG